MPTRLGELLIKEGLITAAELDEALNSQVIFGGKLGTNLIEMGCISEGEIANSLGKATGLPSVDPDELKAVPPDVLALIPAASADKHQIIPVKLNGRRLTVAMTDPSDLPAIDEISFTTGYIIIPMIASEMTITRGLEAHYGIKRKGRTHRVKGATRRREQPAAPPVQEAPPLAQPRPAPVFEVPEFPPLEEFKGFHLTEEPETPPAPPRPQATPPPVQAVQAPPPVEAAPDPPSVTAESISAALAEVRERDHVAELLLTYTALEFDRAAVFIIRGEHVYGWKRIVKNGKPVDFGDVTINLEEPSVLNQVVRVRNFYLGPITDTPENRKMIAGLGGKRPEMALLIPLIVAKRVVAIFYVEGSLNVLGESLMDLQKWANKGTMALEILILKNKIMMT